MRQAAFGVGHLRGPATSSSKSFDSWRGRSRQIGDGTGWYCSLSSGDVEVVLADHPYAVARLAVTVADMSIDLGRDDGRRRPRTVVVQPPALRARRLRRERGEGSGSAGDDHEPVRRNCRQLFGDDLDVDIRATATRSIALKRSRSTRARPPAGTGCFARRGNDQRVQPAQFFLEAVQRSSRAPPRAASCCTRARPAYRLWCAGPLDCGRRSYNRTRTPRPSKLVGRLAPCQGPRRSPLPHQTGSSSSSSVCGAPVILDVSLRLVGMAFRTGPVPPRFVFTTTLVAAHGARLGNDASTRRSRTSG